MKSILVVCERTNIDAPLRRSLGHLVKSCDIKVVPDGYQAFQELVDKAYNLIIVDVEISGIDSLELIESLGYIDPDVPAILMLKQKHKALWRAAQTHQSHPILRPFKPLAFLRLVDTLLHQHLERYRELSAALFRVLEHLTAEPDLTCAFLVDDSGQILRWAGHVAPELLPALGRVAVATGASNPDRGSVPPEPMLAAAPAERDHELTVIPVVEDLWLGLVFLATNQTASYLSPPIRAAVADLRQLIQAHTALDPAAEAEETAPVLPDEAVAVVQAVIPLKFQPAAEFTAVPQADEAYDLAINWQIINDSSTGLDRLKRILGD